MFNVVTLQIFVVQIFYVFEVQIFFVQIFNVVTLQIFVVQKFLLLQCKSKHGRELFPSTTVRSDSDIR